MKYFGKIHQNGPYKMKVNTFWLLFGIAIIKKIHKIGDSEAYMERRQAQIQTFRKGLISMVEKWPSKFCFSLKFLFSNLFLVMWYD